MEELKSVLDVNNEDQESSSPEESSLVTDLSPQEEELFSQMMEVGVFYGRLKTKTNPLMREYILATRAGFEVIDLKKTIVALRETAEFIQEAVKANKGPILLVGTTPAAKPAVKEIAAKLDLPAVTERWLGGTLTNFKIIGERINQFTKAKTDRAAGKFEKYTKKERLELDRDLTRSEILFGGIEKMERLPALILITDLSVNTLAAREAKKVGIPVVAFTNTDADPRLADYKIPANDKNSKSVKLLLDYLAEVIVRAKADKNVVSSDERQDSKTA